MSKRKNTKNRGSFPSDDALVKLFFLSLAYISKKWTMPLRHWKVALTPFTIQFEERIPENQCSPRLHKIRDTLWQRVTTDVGTYPRVTNLRLYS
jgi:hypothetical protein